MKIGVGDGVKAMMARAERSVDLVLVDPPYSKHVHEASKTLGDGDGKVLVDARGKPRKTPRSRDLGFDHLSPSLRIGLARGFARIAKAWVLIFTDIEGAPAWWRDLEEEGLEVVRNMAWVKIGAPPQMSGDRPGMGYEIIIVAHQTRSRGRPMRKHWNGGGLQGVYTHPIVRGPERIHKTQKPVSLLTDLVWHFSNVGDNVFDACAGSGATGVACMRTGRFFEGWELDPATAALANEWLHAESRGNTVRADRMRQEPLPYGHADGPSRGPECFGGSDFP